MLKTKKRKGKPKKRKKKVKLYRKKKKVKNYVRTDIKEFMFFLRRKRFKS